MNKKACVEEPTIAKKILPQDEPEGNKPESHLLELRHGRLGVRDSSLTMPVKLIPIPMNKDQKPYKCIEYGKGFGQCLLLMHLLGTHSEQKAYYYGDCSKAFTQLSNLRQH